MRSKSFLAGILCIVVLGLVFYFPLGAQDRAKSALQEILPGKDISGWSAKGEPEVYVGDDLFLYINGGAEIYHEFGFKRVIVQDYTAEKNKAIALEIYEMASSRGAFGIYTFKTTAQGQQLHIGDQASLEDYYLNFWKGKYLVTLTGFDEDFATIQGLKKIAEGVADKIAASGKAPALTALLPASGLVSAGVKYFMGPLALYNSYRFFADEILSLQEGIRGNYAEGYSVFVFSHKREEEGRQKFSQLCAQFGRDSRYVRIEELDKDTVRILDQKGKVVFLSYTKAHTFIVTGIETIYVARRIFTEIAELIKLHVWKN